MFYFLEPIQITQPIKLTISINGIEYSGELFAKSLESVENKVPEVTKTEAYEEIQDNSTLPVIDETETHEKSKIEDEQNSSSASSDENTQMTL